MTESVKGHWCFRRAWSPFTRTLSYSVFTQSWAALQVQGKWGHTVILKCASFSIAGALQNHWWLTSYTKILSLLLVSMPLLMSFYAVFFRGIGLKQLGKLVLQIAYEIVNLILTASNTVYKQDITEWTKIFYLLVRPHRSDSLGWLKRAVRNYSNYIFLDGCMSFSYRSSFMVK